MMRSGAGFDTTVASTVSAQSATSAAPSDTCVRSKYTQLPGRSSVRPRSVALKRSVGVAPTDSSATSTPAAFARAASDVRISASRAAMAASSSSDAA